MTQTTIGDLLRRHRLEPSFIEKDVLTQKELADQSGVSFSFINRVENDNTSIRLETVNRVLNLLGCELAVIDKKTKKVMGL